MSLAGAPGLAEQAELVTKLSLRDELSRGLLTANANLKKFGVNTGKIGSLASRGISNSISNIEHLGVVAGGAVVGGFTYAVKSASDFEAQLNTINTIAKVTPDALTSIGAGIRGLARDSGKSLDELTQGYYDLLSAGVDAAHAQGVLNSANTLAIGGLASTAETVDLLTTAINSYGVSADKAADFADYFAQAINAGKVTASEIAGSFANVAPLAAAAGIEIQELAAGYAQLTSKGTGAGEASTQMRAAIKLLLDPTKELNDLQKQTGINFAEFAKNNGLAAAYQLIREEADKAGITLPQLTGRIEATNYALQVTGDNAAGYAENLDKVNKATEGVGEATLQANERQKGFAFQFGRLKANVKDVAITIGTELLPQLADLAQEAADFLGKPEQQAKIKQFAQDLAKGFRELVDDLKDVDWKGIASSLQTAAGAGKALLDAFLGAPEWLKTAVLTGWGLNKLTGGALGGIVGELAKGLVKGVLGINAGVVNINAGTVNSAGGGLTPGAAAGLAGVLKGVLGTALISGGLATQTGAFGQGPVQDIAGPLTTIAGAFLVGGPVVGALAAVAEAVYTGFKVRQQVDAAQNDLDVKANEAEHQTSTEALANLKNLNKTLGNQGMWESLVTNTFGAAQTSKGLINLAASITENGQLTSSQVTDAIATLQQAQAVAVQRGWTDAATAIGMRIDELKSGKQGQVSVYGPVQTVPTGQTSVVPGPGFTEYMRNQARAEAAMRDAQLDATKTFVQKWAGIRDELKLGNKHGPAIKAEIAKGLGITNRDLERLRSSYRTEMAHSLGITVGQLQAARRSAHGDDQILAQKLGISVEKLNEIRDKARTTAVNTTKIAGKDFSPNITVNNTFSAKIGISGRTIVSTSDRQRILVGKSVE